MPDSQPSSSLKSFGPVGQGDYIVNQGECLASIAMETGHLWKTIWEDAQNAALKNARGNPNILLPGDRLTIPPIQVKSTPGASGKRHKFVRQGATTKLLLRLLKNNLPRAKEAYIVHVDNLAISGMTDAEGRLGVTISASAESVVVQIGLDSLYVTLGGTDPLEEVTGIQTRLCNLGFFCDYTGLFDDQTLLALNAFRAAAQLPASNTMDDDTKNALMDWHDNRTGKPELPAQDSTVPDGPDDVDDLVSSDDDD